jgi:hypothetical protein
VGHVIDHADQQSNYEYLSREKTHYPDDFEAVRKDGMEKPYLYREWSLPIAWRRSTDIRQTVDVVMHLLFLGLQKTTMRGVDIDWLKTNKKYASFMRYSNGVLEGVQRLNLSWCKAIPYKGGKLGGWVSENFLAVARLAKWFYGRVPDMVGEQANADISLADKKKWTGKVCTQWLRIRGLDTKGSAAEVKERVEAYMCIPTGPPLVLALPTADDLISMQHALAAIISRIMTESVTNEFVLDVERHIKIFLSMFTRLEGKLDPGQKMPSWISSYNFSSLLNIPEAMRMYGPLRNLWEGGYQGEGILRYVKPEASYGMRRN